MVSVWLVLVNLVCVIYRVLIGVLEGRYRVSDKLLISFEISFKLFTFFTLDFFYF